MSDERRDKLYRKCGFDVEVEGVTNGAKKLLKNKTYEKAIRKA